MVGEHEEGNRSDWRLDDVYLAVLDIVYIVAHLLEGVDESGHSHGFGML